MKRLAKTLLRLTGLALGLAAAGWALRERLLPAPAIPDEPPPRFRGVTPPPPAPPATDPSPSPAPEPDDLTAIRGIGPVYAERLAAAGITRFAELAAADAAALAAHCGVGPATAAAWIDRARELT